MVVVAQPSSDREKPTTIPAVGRRRPATGDEQKRRIEWGQNVGALVKRLRNQQDWSA